jgi:hypothetical protein
MEKSTSTNTENSQMKIDFTRYCSNPVVMVDQTPIQSADKTNHLCKLCGGQGTVKFWENNNDYSCSKCFACSSKEGEINQCPNLREYMMNRKNKL